MQLIHNKLTIDVNSEKCTSVIVAKAEDKESRYIDITLTCAGERIVVGNSDRTVLMAEDTSTGSTVAAIDCTVSGGTVVAELTQELLSAPGTLKCEIVVYGTSGAILTSAGFNVIVTPRIDSEVVEREDDFSALESALSDVATTSNRIDELASRVQPVSLGGTGETTITAAVQAFGAASLLYTNSLEAETDLNNIVTPGTYKASSAVSATLTNSPVSRSFVMWVIEQLPSYHMQVLITTLSNEIYIRGTATSNTYNSWSRVSTTDDRIAESGTWTPAAETGTITVSSARYEYDGSRVTAVANIVCGNDIVGNEMRINGLPLAARLRSAGSCAILDSSNTPSMYVNGSTLVIDSPVSLSGLTLVVGITYITIV